MNKVFISLLIFGIAIATATPTTKKKSATCDAYKQAAQNLANLVDSAAKGSTDKGTYLSHYFLLIRGFV